jgi:predicted nucleic acid-binding protein
VGEENDKKAKVKSISKPEFCISTQVAAENINVCLKKLKLDKESAFEHGKKLINSFNVLAVTSEIVESAFNFSKKYQLSWWDSLIVSTALWHNCTTLYSEDMQDGF